MKITEEKVNEINHFIKQSIFELKHYVSNYDEIVVAIPNILIYILRRFRYEGNVLFAPPGYSGLDRIYGANIQPHFKNEVVVFYADYYKNPELFKPKILEVEFDVF